PDLVPAQDAVASARRASLPNIERHALGERERAAEVDRVGGAAHVSLPGIGAGFTAAAALLFAAERAANLGSSRPDVDIGDAAVRAGGGYKPLRLAHIERKDRRGEAGADGVVQPDGVLEFGIAHHIKDRREGFAQDRSGLLRHFAERGAYITSALPSMRVL